MSFRISVGKCSCVKPFADDIQQDACDAIQAQREAWRGRLFADLNAIPREAFETPEISGRMVTVGVHRDAREDGGSLVVFHVFVHTWNKPTFLSIGKIGRIYAEGLLSPGGEVTPAPDELLWEFR